MCVPRRDAIGGVLKSIGVAVSLEMSFGILEY
jgi:hypothetical protein